ncbi:methionyl-tRNA formyltransferase [Bartonella sp. DGB1]|uniref:methionyl-tRNA formyltransferase n=1 Tax=Bartonella sp. DGB1 TaxID=3239807 RepID=UPI0035233329
MALRVAFMGTPVFAAEILKTIVQANYNICAVFSQPARPAGRRGLQLIESPVVQYAKTLNLPIFTPISLKDDQIKKQFADLKIDVAIVVAYGLLLPRFFLDNPTLGCYNIHASLLPRWRGAAPIQRAIMAGDKETGVMIMKMDQGLDTGDIALTAKQKITTNTTATELSELLVQKASILVIEALNLLERGNLLLVPQSDKGITYANKISKDETKINWEQSAEMIAQQINGLSLMPGAWCEMQLEYLNTGVIKTERVKLLKADVALNFQHTGHISDNGVIIVCDGGGAISVSLLQKAGGKILPFTEFFKSVRLLKLG